MGGHDGAADPAMREAIVPFSRALALMLRHRAVSLGLSVRPDGFVSLTQVLAHATMKESLEQALEGASTTDEAACAALVREVVETSLSDGWPRFELWDSDGETWIKATHKHSMRHMGADKKEKSRSQKKDAGGGWEASSGGNTDNGGRGDTWAANSAEEVVEVFVGSLPENYTEDAMWQLFGAYDKVASVKVLSEKRHGFVRFSDGAMAERAIADLNGTEVDDGSRIVVKTAADRKKGGGDQYSRGGGGGDWGGYAEKEKGGGGWEGYGNGGGGSAAAPEPKETLYVKGLPSEITEEEVRNVFEPYGEVASLKLLNNPEILAKGPYMSAAIVRMGTVEEATWLVENVHGNIPVGLQTPVLVNYAKTSGPPAHSQQPRQRVTQAPLSGTVEVWLGSYGWIVPDSPVDHVDAEKRGGKLFVSKGDVANQTALTPGSTVHFQVYSDSHGLGAEAVEVTPEISTGATAGADEASQTVTAWQPPSNMGYVEEKAEQMADPWAQAWTAKDTKVTRPPNRPGTGFRHLQGRLKTFDPEQQYGFIRSDDFDGDIFLALNNIIGPPPSGKVIKRADGVVSGPLVEFDLEFRGGRPRALNASVLQPKEELPVLVQMLPKDAPANVRAYLEGLVRAGA